MKNLGQVCIFSPLITISIQQCGFWDVFSCVRSSSFFDWFQGCNLLGKRKIPKGWGQIQSEESDLFVSMLLVSIDKYHPFLLVEVFKKTVPEAGD